MKVIELERAHPTLEEVIGLAKDELVVLRRPDGSVFALSQVDDFEVEVELLKNNPEFMMFLKQLAHEKAAISLSELRKELGLCGVDERTTTAVLRPLLRRLRKALAEIGF